MTYMSQFTVKNDIVTFINELRMIRVHNQGIMNDKMSKFSVMNDIENDKKGPNIVSDSFARKPDGLLVLNVGRVHSQRNGLLRGIVDLFFQSKVLTIE